MTRYRVLPYRQGSRSARALADALGGRVLRLAGSTFRPRPNDVIINWGNTTAAPQNTIGHWGGTKNNASLIQRASNKLDFFRLMAREAPGLTPDFWETRDAIPDDAFPIVCRTVLAGHSGEGIVIANNRGELVPARLYVKYQKKQDEYRIHVGRRNDQFVVISQQRKARRADAENPNWQVRNHQNGFVYVREGVNPPGALVQAAKRALAATGLDFGAVDVIWNERNEQAYVLEINTAPGLEGQTVIDYTNFFRR